MMMRKLPMAIVAAAALAAAPAQAHPPKPTPKPHPTSHRCESKAVGFNASGTLVSQALTQSAGADTATRSDDRYSGTVTVDVKRANHRSPAGMQTYTLDTDRVRYYDAAGDGTADVPKAGDRVKLKGKLTRLGKHCDATGFTSAIDVRRVTFKLAKVAG
jgi:hypothetical protein